jgi:hypothetical protein
MSMPGSDTVTLQSHSCNYSYQRNRTIVVTVVLRCLDQSLAMCLVGQVALRGKNEAQKGLESGVND